MNKAETPVDLSVKTLLMNFPFTVENRIKNNALMKDNSPYNYEKAFAQWMNLYKILTRDALIYLLPSEKDFQDLPFVANIGVYLPSEKDPTIILSKFKSPPRRGEEKVGEKFFEAMRYKTVKPPFFFEGSADLKYIRDNIYAGSYGIRTELNFHKWASETFSLKIVPVQMLDKKLYHFDCVFARLSPDKALVSASVLANRDVKLLEQVIDIVEVPKNFVYSGWTNIQILKNNVYHAPPSDGDGGKAFCSFMEKLGLNPIIVDLSQFEKNGSDLSCCVMELN